MAVSNTSESLGLTICDESDEVVELCMQCPYDDCISPDRGCAEMRKLKMALKAGEEYHPPENWGAKEPDPQALLDAAWAKLENPASKVKNAKKVKAVAPALEVEELPQPTIHHIKLHHYNEAIKALEVLHDSAVNIGPAIVEMIQAIKTDRSVRFDYLIDWDAVARGGSK